MENHNLYTKKFLVLVILVTSLIVSGCKDDSSASNGTSSDTNSSQNKSGNTAGSGPLVGKWIVDLDATLNYHGFFGGYTDAEKAAYESASFEFTGDKFKYNLREKSGEVNYKVNSVTDQAVILEMPGAMTPTLTFMLRPDGKIILPQDGRWDMLVLKKK